MHDILLDKPTEKKSWEKKPYIIRHHDYILRSSDNNRDEMIVL